MVQLGNIELNGLVYNAAGPRCITEQELIDIDNSIVVLYYQKVVH